jgi:hypothetical protein
MVTTSGLVRGVNTVGMTEGGPIYLSGTAGAFTQTAPTSNIVRVGWCIVAGNNGTVLVHVEKLSVKSADVLDASTGGNGAADSGKLVKYGGSGEIQADTMTTNSIAAQGGSISANSADTETDARSISIQPNQIFLYAFDSVDELRATQIVWPELATGDFTITTPGGSGTLALTSQTNGSITTADVTGLDTELSLKLTTDPTGITGADALTNIVSLTQAEYNDIAIKSPTTLYIIT